MNTKDNYTDVTEKTIQKGGSPYDGLYKMITFGVKRTKVKNNSGSVS
jgi:hypothetical protein